MAVKILLGAFLLINILIFAVSLSVRCTPGQTVKLYLELYKRFFKAAGMLLLSCVTHPILSARYLLSMAMYLIFTVLTALFYPFWVLLLLTFVLPFVVPFVLLGLFPIPFVLRVILSVPAVILAILRLGDRILEITRKYAACWSYLCYARQLFKNSAASASEKMNHEPETPKTDPDAYRKQKLEEWSLNYTAEANKEAEAKAEAKAKEKEKEREKNRKQQAYRYLNAMYEKELRILGLSKQEFTREDLKKRRRDLIKKNHPDNFRAEEDIKRQQAVVSQIQNAYERVITDPVLESLS